MKQMCIFACSLLPLLGTELVRCVMHGNATFIMIYAHQAEDEAQHGVPDYLK
jgi:hypothetical protein